MYFIPFVCCLMCDVKAISTLDTFLVEKYFRATGTRSEKWMTAAHKHRADVVSCIPWVGNGRERGSKLDHARGKKAITCARLRLHPFITEKEGVEGGKPEMKGKNWRGRRGNTWLDIVQGHAHTFYTHGWLGI